MDQAEYDACIIRLVNEKKGYKAIKDLAVHLSMKHANLQVVERELNAEQVAVRRICKSKQSAREKVQCIKELISEDTER